MQKTPNTTTRWHRPVLLALIAITGLAALELVSPSLLPIKGPFALAWHVQTHPVSSWAAATLFFVLTLTSGRILLSLAATTMCGGIIAIASSVKVGYLGSPLTLADVHFFAKNVAENIILFRAYPSLGLMIAAAIATLAAGSVLLWRFEQTRGARFRTVSALALCSLTGCAWYLNDSSYNRAIPKPATFKDDLSTANGFTHLQRFKATGESSIGDLLEIFATDASTDPVLPARVAHNRFKPTTISGGSPARPDIFAILEESTFDPRLLAACNGRPECDSALFLPSPGHQQSGPLFVHSSAGGTWLSEFALITGFDWRSFGPAGAHAPMTLAQRVTAPLPKHLKNLGYQTIAIYPVAGNFLNARGAYKSYGFEHFIATEDLGITADWKHTADATLFEKALSTINKLRDGRPVFIFLLTIRNHGPHAESIGEIPQPIPSSMRDMPAPLVDYLLRMKDSQKALETLSKRWLDEVKTPRVLAWFGDHQPLFAVQSKLSEEYLLQKFKKNRPETEHLRNLTWYSLRSNQNATKNGDNTNKILDLAYLHTELLAFSGLPSQASTAATRQIQAICPIGIVICRDEQAVMEYLSFRIWDLQEIVTSHL